jgi:hypothetical protein
MVGQGRAASYSGIERPQTFACPETDEAFETLVVFWRPYTRFHAVQKEAFPYGLVRSLTDSEEAVLARQMANSPANTPGGGI